MDNSIIDSYMSLKAISDKTFDSMKAADLKKWKESKDKIMNERKQKTIAKHQAFYEEVMAE